MTKDRFRVEELAEAAGISVDLVRSYQSRGLLGPPEHEGRVAWYGRHHLERLRRIRELKDKGWSLRSIADALAGGLQQLVAAAVEGAEETFDRAELAERTGVPAAVLRSFEASGVLRPRHDRHGDAFFTSADVNAVRSLLSLLGASVPMEEFMAVADVQLDAVKQVAEGTYELFVRYLRQPLLDRHLPAGVEAERLVQSLRLLLQSVGTLLTYNFQRTILEVAQRELGEHGTKAEKAALARLARAPFELVPLPEGA